MKFTDILFFVVGVITAMAAMALGVMLPKLPEPAQATVRAYENMRLVASTTTIQSEIYVVTIDGVEYVAVIGHSKAAICPKVKEAPDARRR